MDVPANEQRGSVGSRLETGVAGILLAALLLLPLYAAFERPWHFPALIDARLWAAENPRTIDAGGFLVADAVELLLFLLWYAVGWRRIDRQTWDALKRESLAAARDGLGRARLRQARGRVRALPRPAPHPSLRPGGAGARLLPRAANP
ncbi:MAG: hypothetical protein QM765_43340 [Myxococcales bacterium]